MKQKLPKCILLLMALWCTLTVSAQFIVCSDGFESGSISANWTQENVLGTVNWTVETGALINPVGAANGLYRAKLYATSPVQTRLVSPAINFVAQQIITPTVRFYYASEQIDGVFDTLRVKYSIAGGEWQLVKEFASNQSTWQAVELSVPAAKYDNVKFAFEATAGNGRGVVIDSISIGDQWHCAQSPNQLTISELTNVSAKLGWFGNNNDMGVRYFVVLDSIANHTAVMMDTATTFLRDTVVTNTWRVNGLTPNANYTFWVKSDCDYGDVSPWISQTFTTPCEAVNLPYTENFETYSTGVSADFGCWRKVGTSLPYVTANSTTNPAHGGAGKALYFYLSSGTDKYQYAVMPPVDVTELSEVMLDFWGYTSYAHGIEIGVMTDPSDINTFVSIKKFETTADKVYKEYAVNFKNYNGTGKFIAFKNTANDGTNGFVIDDVHIETLPVCPKPFLVDVPSLTSQKATVTWNTIGTETQWNVKLSTAVITDLTAPANVLDTVVGACAVSLENLTQKTAYYVYVQAACGGEWSEAKTFTTLSNISSIPFVEDFDSYGAGLSYSVNYIPTGWMVGNLQTTSTSYVPFCYGKTAYTTAYAYDHTDDDTNSAHASLRFYNSTSYYGSYAVMPEIVAEPSLQTVALSFWGKYTSNAAPIIVGVLDDLNNGITSFTPVDTIVPTVNWELYTVFFDNYQGNGRFICFAFDPTKTVSSTNYFYIDDLSLTKVASCRVPSDMAAVLSSTTAKLTWTGYKETQWQVRISTTDAMDNLISDTLISGTPQFALSELAPATTYYMQVRAVCSATNSSEWTLPMGFTTYAQIASLPYNNDFDYKIGTTSTTASSVAACLVDNWVCANKNTAATLVANTQYIPHLYGSSSYSSARDHTNNTATTGYNSVKLSTSTTYKGAYMVSPEIVAVDSMKELQISFWAYTATANYKVTVGIMDSPTDLDSFTEIKTFVLPTASVWTECIALLSNYQGTGKYICILSGDGTATNLVYVDDLEIRSIPDCPKVTDVAVSAVSETTASVEWPQGVASAWHLKLFTQSIADTLLNNEVALVDTMLTNPSVVLDNLVGNTRYFAYVQTVNTSKNCAGEWSTEVNFRTNCRTAGETLPFYTDFEGYGTGKATDLLSCWNAGSTTTLIPTLSAHSSSYPVREGDDSKVVLYFSSGKDNYSYAITPMINVEDMRDVQMSFVGAYSSAGNGIYVGVTNSATDMNNFQLVKAVTLDAAKTWQTFDVFFNDLAEEYKAYKYIVFKCAYQQTNAYNYFALDNVKVSKIPDCVKLTDMETYDITSTSAQLDWVGLTERAWNLKLSKTPLTGDEIDTVTTLVRDIRITEQPYKVEGLDPNTTYYAYMQSVNESKNCVGEWNYVVFSTLCTAQALPYTENFDGYRLPTETVSKCAELAGYPDCMRKNGSDATKSYLYGTGCTIKAEESGLGKAVLYATCATGKTSYASFPAMDVDSINKLEITFEAYKTLTNGGKIQVGVMDDPNNPLTYNQVWEDSIATNSTDKKWMTFIVPLNSYKGSGKYITLCVPSMNSSNGVYVDNVVIDSIASCHKPLQVKVNALDQDSVHLGWTAMDGNAWEVRVMPYSANATPEDDVVTDTIVTTNPAAVGGLKPNTRYTAFVATQCAIDNQSAWSAPVDFLTACPDAYAVPYYEDFSMYNTKETTCWVGMNNNAKQDSTATVNVNTETGISVKTLNFPTGSKMLIPLVDTIDFSKLRLSFTMYPVTNAHKITVKLYDKATQVYTNVDVAEKVASVYDKTPTEYSVSFAGFAGKGNAIVLEASYPAYVTNVLVEEDVCAAPINVKVSTRTDTSAVVSWNPVGASAAWEVEYGIAGFELGTGMRVAADTTEVTLLNLTATTVYDVYVRSKCAADTYGRWTRCKTFNTILTPVEVPYATGFEDAAENANWALSKANSGPNAWYIDSTVSHTGNKSLFVSQDSGATYSYSANSGVNYNWAVRAINLPIGKYLVGFDWQNEGAQAYTTRDVLTAALYPSSCTLAADGTNWKTELNVNYTNALTLNLKGANGTIVQGTHQAAWRRDSTIIVVETPGIYYLGFKWYNGTGVADNLKGLPAAVDNVTIDVIPCVTPLNVAAKVNGDSAVAITWGEGLLREWRVKMDTKAFNVAKTAITVIDTIVTDPSLFLNNLDPATTYYYAICNTCDTLSTWTSVNSFTTLCSPVGVPFVESFESYTPLWSGTRPDCWIYSDRDVEASSSRKIYVTSSGYSGKGLMMSSNSWFVLPEMDIDSLSQLEMRFDFACAAANQLLYIGTVTDPYDISTFEAFTSCYSAKGNSGNWDEKELNFTNYKGAGKYIAFKSSSSFYLDSIQIRKMPDCIRMFNIEASDITRNSATFTWEGYKESTWHVKVASAAMNNVELPADVLDTVITEKPFRVNGLTPFTNYYVYVQGICGDTTVGDWSKAYTFTTACGTYTTPFDEDFSVFTSLATLTNNSPSAVANLSCWSLRQGNIDNVFAGEPLSVPTSSRWYIQSWTSLGWNISAHGYLDYTAASSDQYGTYPERMSQDWLISPEVAIEDGNTRLTFDLALAGALTSVTTDKDMFALLISTDAGATWKAEDAMIWDNKNTGNRVLKTISKTGESYTLELAKYAGKVIKVAFYVGVEKNSSADNYMHIDNVSMRRYKAYQLTDSTCEKSDYQNYGFNLPYSEVVADTTLYRTVKSSVCDSLVTLKLSVIPTQRDTIDAEICSNSAYTDFGFNANATGIYYQRLTSSVAPYCDSIVTLNLTVVEMDTVAYPMDTITIEELPYRLGSKLLPGGTPVGNYTDTVVVDSVCKVEIYSVHIEEKTAVDFVTMSSVMFYPNPVKPYSALTIDYHFSSQEQNGLIVEVFNNVGALVQRTMPSTYPIVLDGFEVDGVYVVRIITGNNKLLLGRIIVN